MSSILVAEDNPLNFELARDVLRAGGHSVLWAKDGTEAIDSVRSHSIDLVVLDLHLRNVDGLEVLNTIRADPVLRHLRVLVVSDEAGSDVRDWVLGAGADGYLAEPFKVRDLVSAVGYLINRAAQLASPA